MTQPVYSPLQGDGDAVRLVVVRRGGPADALCCRLTTAALRQPPSYTALSYVGDAGPDRATQSVSLDGRPHAVAASLAVALSHVRRPDADSMLWVDALCVNQDDVTERSLQVALMGRIYSAAAAVLVWLGPEQDGSGQAMGLIRRLAAMDRRGDLTRPPGGSGVVSDMHLLADWASTFLNRRWPGSIADRHELEATLSWTRAGLITLFKPLAFLLERPWFWRRWSLHEIALATDASVCCGSETVSWAQFTACVSFLQRHEALLRLLQAPPWDWPNTPWASIRDSHGRAGDLYASHARKVILLREWLHKAAVKPQRLAHIGNLVAMFSDRQTPEPRDYVYALLSLASDPAGTLPLVPDYTKSVVEVCADLVTHTISSQLELDLICRPWAPVCDGLPSWIMPRICPDMSPSALRKCRLPIPFVGLVPNCFYQASQSRKAQAAVIRLSSSRILLQAKGFVADTILSIGHAESDGALPISWFRHVYACQESKTPDSKHHCNSLHLKRYLIHPLDSEIFNHFWPTLVGGRTPDGAPVPTSYSRAARTLLENGHKIARDNLLHLSSLSDDSYQVTSPSSTSSPTSPTSPTPRQAKERLADFAGLLDLDDCSDFITRIQECTWNRRLIQTSCGRFGLVPAATRKGDLICILLGCNVPLILRPEGGYCTLVGDAYIHGIMDGYAITELDQGRHQLVDFKLA